MYERRREEGSAMCRLYSTVCLELFNVSFFEHSNDKVGVGEVIGLFSIKEIIPRK